MKRSSCRRWMASMRTVALLMAALLLQGCWDEVDLGDVSYITALGIDYKDGSYQLYSQMIKFAVVAKTDAPQPEPDPVWIGNGTGASLQLALADMAKGAQMTLSMEQLKAVVVHERALGKLDDIMDGLNRQRATRYTSLLFGTRDSIANILTGETFFDQSPLHSLLYSPAAYDKQQSFIKPFAMQLAVQSLKEPAMTTVLPVIAVNEGYWQHQNKPLKTQIIEGIFVFRETKFLHYLPEAQVTGLRWLNPEFKHYLLEADGRDGRATVAVNASKSLIHADTGKGTPSFELELSLTGSAAEVDGRMTQDEIIEAVQKKVKRQLEDTYKTGVANRLDLYGLEHHLYRYHLAAWKKSKASGDWEPKDYPLKIAVKMNLVHSGKLDLHKDT
ncbi:Ger(x)C family spore germination protein [Paenibacillus sp. N4]|uniref:Ger(x)C family spore germination protein n=1 Tax=Paenibacillus vietnamensis TaxID=2590547 RepID=UPI001CD0B216|nr:Ger(x)C family spore germination protein [Paenibacillus vietnamensis]MCA0755437.1 Ger(x)C family spore germination protein [Paenibacillus vietnamensis]